MPNGNAAQSNRSGGIIQINAVGIALNEGKTRFKQQKNIDVQGNQNFKVLKRRK